MSNQYDPHEIQNRLSEFVQRAAAGEEITVMMDGKPMAKLEALPAGHPALTQERKRKA